MDLGLKGKVALVLGAGSGLGAAIALGLAEEGAKVAVAGRTLSKVQATVAEIGKATNAMAVGWDLSDLSVIDANIAHIEKTLGPIEILILNTGGPPPTTATGQSVELWQQQFQSMVLSVIAIADRVLPGMRSRGFGRIITSTSSGVVEPIAGIGISNTLRASLVGWSKTVSNEVARDGVTANVVVPGRITTERLAAIDMNMAQRKGRSVAEVQAQMLESIPMGRYGTPQEYADMVVFLASTRASYVTGSVVRVDGGAIHSV